MGFERAVQASIVRIDMWFEQNLGIMIAAVAILAETAIVIQIWKIKEACACAKNTKLKPKPSQSRRKM